MSRARKRIHVSLIIRSYNGSGMDPTSLAAALAGAQMSQVQMAIAAKMLRMNTDAAGSIVQVLDAAQRNIQTLANVAAGVGQNLNITA